MRSKLDFVDRLSLVDSLLGWVAYISKITALVVCAVSRLRHPGGSEASLSDLLEHFLPFFVAHCLMMVNWISGGRSLAIMSDVAQLVAAPRDLESDLCRATQAQGAQVQGHCEGRRPQSAGFVEWPLITTYAPNLVLTLIGISQHVCISNSRRRSSAASGGWHCLELVQPCPSRDCRVRLHRTAAPAKAERFESRICGSEFEQRRVRLQLSDISVSGARIAGSLAGIPLGSRIVFQLRGHSANATVVRNTSDGFAVHFDDTLESRVAIDFYKQLPPLDPQGEKPWPRHPCSDAFLN